MKKVLAASGLVAGAAIAPFATACAGAAYLTWKYMDKTAKPKVKAPVEKIARPVLPASFVSRMEKHWTSELGNASSAALRKVWYQIARVFNYHIMNHDTSKFGRWDVLSPPTGSGKTEGTVIYSAMLSSLSDENHPGAIIVTRLIKDCDKIAKRINQFGSRSTAVSYHSQSKNKLIDLKKSPVLVITHRAYEKALDFLGHEDNIETTWPHFHRWGKGSRKLVVIDESLDIIEHYQIGLDLKGTTDIVPKALRRRFDREIRVLNQVAKVLTQSDYKRAAIVRSEYMPKDFNADFPSLIIALKDWYCDSIDREIFDKHIANLRSVHYLLRSWSYTAPTYNDFTMNTARTIVADSVKGAVVMDATADTNFVYNIHTNSKKAKVPAQTRNYQNFTLHVSRGHRVGKSAMSDKRYVQDMFYTTMSNLAPQLFGKRPLVICHKSARETISQLIPQDWCIGHWGQIDGSNQWKDCDTVIVLGLPYLPDIWAINTYMALQGPQDDAWLNDTSSSFINAKEMLKQGMLSTSIIQGINRICTRKVIDVDGNCPPADGFILLPHGEAGDTILRDIERNMPGAKIVEWDCSKSMESEEIADIEDPFSEEDIMEEYMSDSNNRPQEVRA